MLTSLICKVNENSVTQSFFLQCQFTQ